MGARAVETKRPNPCGLLVGITGPARDTELTDCRNRAEKAEGALDAAEKRASKAETKLKKLEAEMPS